MSALFSPFSRSRAGDAWFCAGPTSAFPNITSEDAGQLADPRPCQGDEAITAGCKVFHVPRDDSSRAAEVPLTSSDAPPEVGGLRDQVLIFQYKGKFHAINHVSKKRRAPTQVSHHGSLLIPRTGMPSLVIPFVQRCPLRH